MGDVAPAEMLIDDKVDFVDVDKSDVMISLSLSSQAFLENRNETSELYRSLMVHWRNELGAPELLQYWEGCDEVKTLLEEAEEATVSNEEVGCSLPFDVDVLFKCERDRMRYMLIEYLRTRMLKIEAFASHLLQNEAQRSLLSSSELRFCESFEAFQKDLVAGTIGNSLSGIPEVLVQADAQRAQPHPNLSRNVFAQFRRTVGDVELGADAEPVTLEAGDLYVLPYVLVQKYIASGDAVIV